MHNNYLKTIGFQKYVSSGQEKNLLASVIANPDRSMLVNLVPDEKDLNDANRGIYRMGPTEEPKVRQITMIEKYFTRNRELGIRILGEYDEQGHFLTEKVIPFAESGLLSTEVGCTIEMPASSDVLFGLCDDYKVGLTLIFTISNFAEVFEHRRLYKKNPELLGVSFCALASEGHVILPVYKTEQQVVQAKKEIESHMKMVEAAKQGDRDAIDNLTVDDVNLYTSVVRRIAHEDLYTVIDTFILPVGVECDQYQVMGTIMEYKLITNEFTGEAIYKILVEANHMPIQVYMAKDDLVGELAQGRRLKCNLWLQGEVAFI